MLRSYLVNLPSFSSLWTPCLSATWLVNETRPLFPKPIRQSPSWSPCCQEIWWNDLVQSSWKLGFLICWPGRASFSHPEALFCGCYLGLQRHFSPMWEVSLRHSVFCLWVLSLPLGNVSFLSIGTHPVFPALWAELLDPSLECSEGSGHLGILRQAQVDSGPGVCPHPLIWTELCLLKIQYGNPNSHCHVWRQGTEGCNYG